MQDAQLHRLVCYLKSSLSYRQYSWVGDKLEDLQLHLYTDADLASDPEDSVSTSGAYLALVGPRTHVPLAHRSKRQTAVSHSSTESELVSADHGLKTLGLPALDLWEVLLQRKPGEVGLRMFQDNDACCRVCRSGKNPNMVHIGRTHRISIAWLYEQLQQNEIKMYRADSELMAADIFTKAFPEGKLAVWQSNLSLINIYDEKTSENMNYHPSMVQSLRGDLDKPKTALIQDAELSEEDDSAKPAALAAAKLAHKPGGPTENDDSTVCPSDSDSESIRDFDEDDFRWDTHDDAPRGDDWTSDFALRGDDKTSCGYAADQTDIVAECKAEFDSASSRDLLAMCGGTPPCAHVRRLLRPVSHEATIGKLGTMQSCDIMSVLGQRFSELTNIHSYRMESIALVFRLRGLRRLIFCVLPMAS